MESFKKDLYLKEYGVSMSFQPFSGSERLYLEGFLEQQYGVGALSNNGFFRNLLEKLPNKKEYRGIDTLFESGIVFQDLVSQNDLEVFVIWTYPNDIDKFKYCPVLIPPT